MSVFVKGGGGATNIVSKANNSSQNDGNWNISYTCPNPGVYMLVVSGTGTNTNFYINTPTCSNGTVTSYDILTNPREQSQALTKAFVIKANAAGATVSCSCRFSGYTTKAYRMFALQ